MTLKPALEGSDAWYKKALNWAKKNVYDPYMKWTNAQQTWLKWLVHAGAILAIVLIPVLLILLCCLCCRKNTEEDEQGQPQDRAKSYEDDFAAIPIQKKPDEEDTPQRQPVQRAGVSDQTLQNAKRRFEEQQRAKTKIV